MGYRHLRACVLDLERHGHLRRVEVEIDPYLEMAEIHRRVYQAGGPALFFGRVKGCAFPMVSNLFGTIERTRFLFRDTLAAVRHLVELKVDPCGFSGPGSFPVVRSWLTRPVSTGCRSWCPGRAMAGHLSHCPRSTPRT